MAFLLKPIVCTLAATSSKKFLAMCRILSAGKNSAVGFCSLPAGKLEENLESSINPVFHIATNHLSKVAINDQNGTHTYQEILQKSLMLAKKIQAKLGHNKTQERIVFLCPNDVTYVIAQWACWASGHIGK